jgi:hypothetical protein
LATFTELSWKSCSFFVVTYQAEHKNDKDSQQKGWQVPELATKPRFWLNFYAKRQNLGQMWPNSRLSPTPLGSLAHFLLYPIRLSKKMAKGIKLFTDKYRNWRQMHRNA